MTDVMANASLQKRDRPSLVSLAIEIHHSRSNEMKKMTSMARLYGGWRMASGGLAAKSMAAAGWLWLA